MLIRKALRLATLIAASAGVLSTATVTGILAMNSTSDSQIFAADTRHYKGEWYNDGALVYEGYFTRGQDVAYEGPTPTKTDYTGEKIYIFSGWDTTGDGVPDLPVFKAYSNFKANATFASIDASLLEKIDWQKLLEILMDKNIDLEALLARLGLSPEDIAKLLNLNVLTITSDVAGPAYLRTESFKDYSKQGHNWSDADYYPVSNISPGSVNPLQYTANKLSSLNNNALIASYCKEGTYEITYNKTGNKYPVVAFESRNDQNLPTDSYSLASVGEDKKYVSQGYALIPCTEETVIAGMFTNFSNDAIKNDERVYREYVKKQYLGVDDEYRSYFQNLANRISAPVNNVGQAVTKFTEYLTQNFTLEYKHNEFPKASDPLLYFMNEAKVADSNYFATAMTLFLRSLGYPARYTQGYMAAIPDAGVETGVTALQAYSWCEVYVEGIGWMNADGAEYLLVKLFDEYYDLPDEVLEMMDFSNKGTSRQLESIYIGDNTKFDYIGGTEFSIDDIELIAKYDDGYEEKVEPCFVAKPDISNYKSYYDVDVTVLYDYLSTIKSATYTIHVEPARIEQLNVYNNRTYTTVSYVGKEHFSFDGLYSNGKTYYIDPYSVQFEIPEIIDPGDYPIECTYTEYYSADPNDYATVTTTFMLHINPEPQIIGIEPMYHFQDTFYVGDEFYFDRYSWYALRDDGEITSIEILDEYILNPEVMSTDVPGNYTLLIQPADTCEVYEYNFTVIENVVCELNAWTSQYSYYIEDGVPFDLIEANVQGYAYYLDGNGFMVSYEDLEFSQTEFYEPGLYQIEAYYTEETQFSGTVTVSDTLEIKLEPKPSIVSIYPTVPLEDLFYVDQVIHLDRYNWIANYSDGTSQSIYIDDSYLLNPEVMNCNAPGEYALYIKPSATCETYEYNFEVIENLPVEIRGNTGQSAYYLDSTSDVFELDQNMLSGIILYTDGSFCYLYERELELSQTEFEEPGFYEIEVSYTEVSPFTGPTTISTTMAFNLVFNDVVSFSPQWYGDVPSICVNDELTPELFSNFSYHVTRLNGSSYILPWNDPSLTYDFSEVDNTKYGSYDVTVEYKYDENLDPVYTTIPIKVVGISEMVGNFEGVPENLYCGLAYTEEDFKKWGLGATVTYSNGSDFTKTEYHDLESEYLTAKIDGYPFESSGYYNIVLTYDDGHESRSDYYSIYVEPDIITDVIFDLSSIDGNTYKYDEEIDFSKITVTAKHNNGLVDVYKWDSEKISFSKKLVDESPDQYVYTFSITLMDVEYTEEAAVTIIKPVAILVDDESIRDYYHISHSFGLSEFDISIKYDDDSVVDATGSKFVSFAFDEEELKPGYNTLVFTFDDGTYKYTVSKEILLYDVELQVKIGDGPYFDQDYFDDDFQAAIHYNAGKDKDGNDIKIKDDVDVTETTTYTPTTPLNAHINELTFKDTYQIDDENYSVVCSTVEEIDAYTLVDVEFEELNTTCFRLDKSLDYANAKLIGTFQNSKGTETEIKKEVPFSVFKTTQFSTKSCGTFTAKITLKVGVKYWDLEFEYTVIEPQATSVTLDTSACRLETYEGYVTGNSKVSYDISKMKYVITYENGQKETFTYTTENDYIDTNLETVPLNNESAPGKYTFKFSLTHTSYNGQESFIDLPVVINVLENNITEIMLNTLGAKTVFYYGSSYSSTGLVVYAVYDVYKVDTSIGVGRIVISPDDYSLSYNDPLLEGKNTVIVTYTDEDKNKFEASYDVTYKEDKVKNWHIYNYPTDVLQGETIDFSKIKATGTYESGKTITLTYSDLVIGGNPSTDELGTTTFTVSYKGEQIGEGSIEVLADHSFKGLQIEPGHISFDAGDTESYKSQIESLEVTALFYDKDPRVLSSSEYTYSDESVKPNVAGTYSATITAKIGSETRSIGINVIVTTAFDIKEVTIPGDPYQFTVGQKYNPEESFDSVQIRIEYNDGTSKYINLGDESVIYYNFKDVFPTTVEPTEEPEEVSFIIVIMFNGEERMYEVAFTYEVVEP